MKIELPDEIAEKTGLGQKGLTELLAVFLYKLEKINGVEGGKILGSSEIEFHGVVAKYGHFINYDGDDLDKDINNLKDF